MQRNQPWRHKMGASTRRGRSAKRLVAQPAEQLVRSAIAVLASGAADARRVGEILGRARADVQALGDRRPDQANEPIAQASAGRR